MTSLTVAFEMRPEVQAAYDRFVKAHYGEIVIPELCESMYNAGANAAVQAMIQFQDIEGWMARVDRRLGEVRRTLGAITRGPR